MLFKCAPCILLLLAMLAAASATQRYRRQYSGRSNVGYSGATRRYRPGRTREIKQCVDIHELENGQVICGFSGCRMRCLSGYNFISTEKSSRITLNCDHSTGELKFRNQIWKPELTLCSPVCSSPCRNGGTCEAPDKCSCTWPYTGETCEDQRMVGDDPNAGYTFGQEPVGALQSNQRHVKCEPGTQMPDGSTSVVLSYKDGHWFYPDDRVLLGAEQVECKKISVSNKPDQGPSVQPPRPVDPISNKPRQQRPASLVQQSQSHSCTPSCQHGGECVSTNVCSCPLGYWGPVCQVRICSYPWFDADLHATLGGTLRRIKFECRPGYHTRDNRDRVVVLCHQGSWRLPNGRLLTVDDVKCV